MDLDDVLRCIKKIHSERGFSLSKGGAWDESKHPRVAAGSPEGGEFTSEATYTAINSHGKQVNLTPIKAEVDFIRSYVQKHSMNSFEALYLVGSWAAQEADRMPDRHGINTSDIDLMMEPKGWEQDWKTAVKLEKEFTKRFARPIQLNIVGPLGGKAFVDIGLKNTP